MLIYSIIFAVIIYQATACGDFYWRDYNGTIPKDAISAGYNKDGDKFYIGHAYMHYFGIPSGTITPGRTEMTMACYGVRKTSVMIRILCAQKHSRYYWLRTKSEYYINSMRHRCPVVGGWDMNNVNNHFSKLGTLHVGRVIRDDEIFIGNIAAYDMESNREPYFYYPYKNKEIRADTFDVLVYTDSPLAIYNGVNNIHDLDLAVVKDR